MKKHAFLMLVHKQPELMGRIVKVLASPTHFFYIHVDKKSGNIEAYRKEVRDIPNVFFMEDRESIYHCGISHLYALIRMFKEAASSPNDYDYYHVISGQDYPLRSNEQFDSFFEGTDHSFMWIDQYQTKLLNFKYHYWSRSYHPNNTSTRWAKLYQKLHLALIPYLLFRRKPIPNYTGGWDWFSWNKKVLKYFLSEIERNPQIVERYNYTVCPTEHIFHTMVNNVLEEMGIEATNPLRYISWRPHREISNNYLPFIFREEDYEYIIDSKAFFCRKVDQYESATLLDMIDGQRGSAYRIEQHDTII